MRQQPFVCLKSLRAPVCRKPRIFTDSRQPRFQIDSRAIEFSARSTEENFCSILSQNYSITLQVRYCNNTMTLLYYYSNDKTGCLTSGRTISSYRDFQHENYRFLIELSTNLMCKFHEFVDKFVVFSGRSRIFQRGRQFPRGVRQHIISPSFCRKLHENERIWTKAGTGDACPLESANGITFHDSIDVSMK